MRVGWKVHRLTIMMQWSNFTKCDLFFNIVSLGFPWYRSSHPDPWKSTRLQIRPYPQSDTASQPSGGFSCWGTENSQMVPNQQNIEGDQPVESHSHAQQPLQPQTCVQEHCPGETGLPSSVFQAAHKMSLVLLFKVLNYLSTCSVGLHVSGKKQCSKYRKRMNLMHATFHCCRSTPFRQHNSQGF